MPLKRRPEDAAPESERRCIVTGEAGARNDLLRFVLDPEGVVTLDLARALPGRGASVSLARSAVRAAVVRGAFSRAFKRPARLADGLDADRFADAVEAALRARATAALGLARRVGDVVLGFDATRRALSGEGFTAGVALAASDASPAEVGRLLGGWRGATLRCFSAEDLSAAMGAHGVVYAAVRAGTQAARLQAACDRLASYRDDAPPSVALAQAGMSPTGTETK